LGSLALGENPSPELEKIFSDLKGTVAACIRTKDRKSKECREADGKLKEFHRFVRGLGRFPEEIADHYRLVEWAVGYPRYFTEEVSLVVDEMRKRIERSIGETLERFEKIKRKPPRG